MPTRKVPTSTYLRYAVVATAALFLLLFLNLKGRTVVYKEHELFQEQLRQLIVADADLTEALYRVRQNEPGALDTARARAGIAAELAGRLTVAVPRFVRGESQQEINALILTLGKTFETTRRLVQPLAPGTTEIPQQLFETRSRQALQNLSKSYTQCYDRAFQEAHLHRLYLYAFALVLLGALFFALLRLRGASHALRTVSDTLDERVRNRTQELIESNASLQEVVAQLLQTEASLRESQERYELAARGANDGLWDWNLVSGRVYYSPRWKEMLGWGSGEVSESIDEWLKRVHGEDLEGVKEALDEHVAGTSTHFDRTFRMLHRDGTYRWVLVRGLAVRDEHGKARRMAGSQSDITERKLVEDRMRHDARHDALTGLANRSLFLDRLDHALKLMHRRSRDLFAVLFLDLDRFKLINDSLGHAAGDELLKETARRIESCLRASDTASRLGSSTVSRLGGDEFAVLVENLPDPTAAVRVAERIEQRLSMPYRLAGNEVATSASVGIALASKQYQTPDELLRDADTAMYRAKQLGKARHAIFDQEMHAQAMSRLQLEAELRRAVDAHEFELHFQPIVSISTGRTEGFEALLRWRHPERGLLPPAEYLTVLEEMGLSVPMSWWVVREACRHLREWQAMSERGEPLFMNVNFSSRQFNQSGMIDALEGILSENNLNSGCFNVEFTESVLLTNPDAAGAILARLQTAGVGRYLDDFGVGYSSLNDLHRFPLTAVKVDRALVNRAIDSHEYAEITRAICVLAANLGINVVAVGVETPEQLAFLRSLGCDRAQGYLFARPLAAADVPETLLRLMPVS